LWYQKSTTTENENEAERGKKSWLANDAVKLIVLGMKVTLTANIETNLDVVSPTRQTVDE